MQPPEPFGRPSIKLLSLRAAWLAGAVHRGPSGSSDADHAGLCVGQVVTARQCFATFKHHSVAVVLDLVQPVGTWGRLVRLSGQRKRIQHCAGQISRRDAHFNADRPPGAFRALVLFGRRPPRRVDGAVTPASENRISGTQAGRAKSARLLSTPYEATSFTCARSRDPPHDRAVSCAPVEGAACTEGIFRTGT
jgi:hypothetical protein